MTPSTRLLSGFLPPLLVIPVIGVAYLLTMPGLITLEDAGLFQMVCHLGGISHPPGYPLFTLLCNQITVVPTVFNGNMVSVVFALGALLCFYLVVLEITADGFTAWVAAAAYGLSASFWSQAIIIEVYSLAAMMFMLCWWLLLRYIRLRDVRYWYALCLAGGLALSNHWPLFVLSCLGFPGLLVEIRSELIRRMQQWRFWFISLLALCLGLLPYVTLLTTRNPEIAVFGAVEPDELLQYISRAYYDDDRSGTVLQDKLRFYRWLLDESILQLGWVAVPSVLVGLVASLRLLPLTRSVSLLGVYLASTFLLMTLVNMKFEMLFQGVFKPYTVIAYSVVAFWFAYGTSVLLKQVPAAWQRALLAVLLLAGVALYNGPRVDRSGSTIVDEYGRLILRSLPENSILMVAGDNQIGPIGYLNRVEGLRPDVELYAMDGLVFRNRLFDVRASEVEREKTIRDFIRASDRSVYTVGNLPYANSSFGLYYGYDPGTPDYVFEPDFDRYLDLLLNLYQRDLLRNLHEKQFAYVIIAEFTRQYVGFSLRYGVDAMTAAQKTRLQGIQASFPGKITTLETILVSGAAFDPDLLLQLALAAEAQVTEQLPRQHVSVLNEYLGLIEERRGSVAEAERRYLASLELMPDAENRSVCHLAKIYRAQGRGLAYDQLNGRYGLSNCPER